eukprot:2284970-Prymnesium_polylepis.2
MRLEWRAARRAAPGAACPCARCPGGLRSRSCGCACAVGVEVEVSEPQPEPSPTPAGARGRARWRLTRGGQGGRPPRAHTSAGTR